LFFLFRKGLSHPRLISLQLSKERNFLRQRQQKETGKRKKSRRTQNEAGGIGAQGVEKVEGTGAGIRQTCWLLFWAVR
jgi:hypothetical protein